jgi:SEC-C motif-containing protein
MIGVTKTTDGRRGFGRLDSPACTVQRHVRDCPCHSGARYAACCGPVHERKSRAATPEALMRSRYSAFALGLGYYLVETLASDHPDRAGDVARLVQALSRAKDSQRFLGLRILDSGMDGDRGHVTFHARIFERGADRSFGERSRFRREDGAWRYEGGDLTGDLPPEPAPRTP